MLLVKGFCAVFIICASFAQEVDDEGRGLRDYNQEWKALDSPPSHDPSAWIPHPITETEQPLKRRRIRKRKRRPPVLTDDEPLPPRRKIRPQRLKEPWEEMSEETQKTNNRRRLTPVFDETEEVTDSKVTTFERVRDPFTALQEAEEKQRTKVDTPDLKTLLKQSGGLSLSEVLQQRNLTLAELLKGNRQAISALVAETTTERIETTESVKYRRLPPSVALKKDRNFIRNSDLSSHEVTEAQRKRLALLHGHKKSEMFPDVVKFDVVTEETTEKRVFVPSSPKFSTSADLVIITTEAPMTTTTTTEASTIKPRQRKLPMTSATLSKLNENVPKIPEKAVPISLNEIFGLGNFKNETEDGPLKMIIDIAEMVTTENPIDEETQTQATPVKLLEELTLTTTMSIGGKLKHKKLKNVTAKEEIMEILKNPRERESLSRILRTRNMTVEELVAQRERGSSQLHLADIFHNKTREPEPIEEPLIGEVLDFTSFNRKGKTILLTSTQPSTTEEITTTKLPYTITSFPTYKIETNKDTKTQNFPPLWQQLYPNFFPDVYENQAIVRPLTTTTEGLNYEEVERLEEIENALAEAANGRLKVELPEYEDEEEFIKLPSGVKSAILASLAIVGLSLLVFLTILLIFKISQKKKRLTYSGSFSPILEANQGRTFRNFVSETLGKKKNYYKAHIQSMSDSIWDKDEKKSYLA